MYKRELEGRIAADKKTEQYKRRTIRLESELQQALMNMNSQPLSSVCAKDSSLESPEIL